MPRPFPEKDSKASTWLTNFGDKPACAENTDLRIICGDGAVVAAHRAILAAHHGAWNAIFQELPILDEDATIITPDFNSREASAELQMIYYNDVSGTDLDADKFPILNIVGNSSYKPPKPVEVKPATKAVKSIAKSTKTYKTGGRLKSVKKAKAKTTHAGFRLRQVVKEMPWLNMSKVDEMPASDEDEQVNDLIDTVNQYVAEEVVIDDGPSKMTLVKRPAAKSSAEPPKKKKKKDVEKSCELCGKKVLASQMANHSLIHYPDKWKHRCDKCDLVFMDVTGLETHKSKTARNKVQVQTMSRHFKWFWICRETQRTCA